MRLTIFVTLFWSLLGWSQVGLNGQISTQSGFTRTQLERESNGQAVPQSNQAGNVVIYGGGPSDTCLTTACRMAGTFGCDEQDEITSLSRACRGNPGDSCLKQVCINLGEFGCDEHREIRRILFSCGSGDTQPSVGQRVPDLDDRQRLTEF